MLKSGSGEIPILTFVIIRGDVNIHQSPSQPFSFYYQLGHINLPPFTLAQAVEAQQTGHVFYYQFNWCIFFFFFFINILFTIGQLSIDIGILCCTNMVSTIFFFKIYQLN